MTKFWIGVVSKEHVLRGVEGGFCQVCHGKKGPLNRMKKGDYLLYYSPKYQLNSQEKLQAFTAVGKIINDTAYQVEMFEGFFLSDEMSATINLSETVLLNKLDYTLNGINMPLNSDTDISKFLKTSFFMFLNK